MSRLRSFFRRSPEPVAASTPTAEAAAVLAAESITEPVTPTAAEREAADYQRRSDQEHARFSEELEIHDLPPIFHYWSHTYLLPMMQHFGFENPDQLFANTAIERAAAIGRPVRILSLGAGNCDTEVRVGELLKASGLQDWQLTCMDLVPEMLDRGRELARGAGLEDHFAFIAADINTWDHGQTGYDVVIANQFLHHVVDLETLFARVLEFMSPEGRFVTSDMIGRNGHQRWPESLEVVQEFWKELPETYRYQRQLGRQEHEFLDWDCSQEGFEGIRAQDVLPLLVENFGFESFMGFANVIGPFVDRGFGPNFDATAEWDRDFIDRVHAKDVELMASGVLKPTQIMAVMTADKTTVPRVWQGLTPEASIRVP